MYNNTWTNTSEEWLERAIFDGHVNYIEYNKFTNRKSSIGGFGTVFKYEWKDCELTVALEYYNGYYNMVLQYANEGNLREYLKTNFIKSQWTDKLRIAKEIAFGLSFLHNYDINHRDLPQCLIKKGYKRDKRSDIYSFGVILWEISSGRPPFQAFESKMELCFHIFQGNREEPIEGTPSQYPNHPDEILTQNNERPFSNQDIKPIANLFDITTSSPFDFPGLIDSYEITKEALKHVKEGRYSRALELYEELLKNSQQKRDRLSASRWDLYYLNPKKEGKALSDALGENSTLTSLNFDSGNFGSVEVKALTEEAEALCKITTLASLKICPRHLEPGVGKAIAGVICKNTTLTSLSLKHNELGVEELKILAEALYKNTTLTFLDLYKDNIGSEGGKALAEVLCKNTTLTSLNLCENNLGSEGGNALADALCKNTTLPGVPIKGAPCTETSLDLSRNKLGPEVGNTLADALYKSVSLKDLKLQYNKLGPGGGKALAEAHCKNTALTSLDLEDNELGSDHKNITLVSLKLGNNELGPDVGKGFAEVLCKNTTLTFLSLNNNYLNLEGGKTLADALCQNISLISLDISYNNLKPEGGKLFANVLYKNTALTSLDLSVTGLDSEEENH
ncbi:hypothetical protein C2G38_2238823 [Gigaspora rosea]|uniref:Protein kinase domain-containing protein n=1 Tax=Gigaspora rosea TaxID=44941 RepID=A0A397WAH1_9GLOM|nr:hypothetical protein C2G38_2238823 [Gigaspora rosea]